MLSRFRKAQHAFTAETHYENCTNMDSTQQCLLDLIRVMLMHSIAFTRLKQQRPQLNHCSRKTEQKLLLLLNSIPFRENQDSSGNTGKQLEEFKPLKKKGYPTTTALLWQQLGWCSLQQFSLLKKLKAIRLPPVMTVKGCSTGCRSLGQLPLPLLNSPL